jgi:hypothetical protein
VTDPSTTQIITDNVREEADKWRDLSKDMKAVAQNPVAHGLDLASSAFFIGPTELVATATHHTAYVDYLHHVQKLVGGAATEWEELRSALHRMADEFDTTDQTVTADLEKIYTQPAGAAAGLKPRDGE